MVLEMVGGPFAGLIHEVDEHVPVPVSIGLLRDHMRHWYMVDADAGVARYSHCEAGGPSPPGGTREYNKAMMAELLWWRCDRCKMNRPRILVSDIRGVCKICAKGLK